MNISKVVESGLCTGCGLCASIAPDKVRINIDAEGYLRPQETQPLSPQELAEFKRACPGILLKHERTDGRYDKVWGPIVESRTGYSLSPDVRYQGSSGGVISSLLIYLLETKKVDFVAHVKVSDVDPLGNMMSISRTREEVLAGAGSRYAPSAPLASIHELLKMDGVFAIVGKPCDIAGLRNYERLHPEIAQKIPYKLSFMCAGIPSRLGTIKIVENFGVKENQVKSFTYRGNGWPGMTTLVTNENQKFETDYNSSWGTVLNRHLQFRCKICPDGTGEFADVVGADAWYGKDGYPDFSEKDGRSLVLSRTNAGEALVKAAAAYGVLQIEALDIGEIEKMQPYQKNRKQMIFARLMGLRVLGRPYPRYVNLRLLRAAITANWRENARNFVGLIRRAKL